MLREGGKESERESERERERGRGGVREGGVREGGRERDGMSDELDFVLSLVSLLFFLLVAWFFLLSIRFSTVKLNKKSYQISS